MPKVYHRKSFRASWSTETMTQAAEAVKAGEMNLSRASKEFAVPRNTLRDRVQGNAAKKPYERPSVLGDENERALSQRIIRLQRLGFGLTITDVRRLAFQFCEKNSVPNNLFNDEKGMAGWDWYRGFMRRHPELAVRQAQNISHARAQCMNRPVVNGFFDMYENEVNSLAMRTSPHCLFNADETGVQMHLRPAKVLAAKGNKSVLQVTNAERGENVTVMACCSASGYYVPPMVIFKGKRKKPEFADGMPPGTLVVMSESGYISSELFLKWLEHFQAHRPAGNAVLIIDGHASHVKSVAVLDYASANQITMICLPPHTTHFIQPLDRSFFRPLKTYFDQACKTFQSNHPGRAITKLQFGTLLSKAWGKAASAENAMNGFRVCGLYPIDRQAIPDYAFAPAEVSETTIQSGVAESVDTSTPVRAPESSSTEHADTHHADTHPSTPAQSEPVPSSVEVSFSELHPTPKIKRVAKKPGGRKQSAAVLTSPTYRKALFENIEGRTKQPAADGNMVKPKTGIATEKGKKKRISLATNQHSSTKKKKVTCRLDEGPKPPMLPRSPKLKQKTANKTGKSKKTTSRPAVSTQRDTTPCGTCGIRCCDDAPPRSWIQCQRCTVWYHNECQGLDEHGPGMFECIICENAD